MSDSPVWFSSKRTGFGIRPSHPIGWLITALFVAVFIISNDRTVVLEGIKISIHGFSIGFCLMNTNLNGDLL